MMLILVGLLVLFTGSGLILPAAFAQESFIDVRADCQTYHCYNLTIAGKVNASYLESYVIITIIAPSGEEILTDQISIAYTKGGWSFYEKSYNLIFSEVGNHRVVATQVNTEISDEVIFAVGCSKPRIVDSDNIIIGDWSRISIDDPCFAMFADDLRPTATISSRFHGTEIQVPLIGWADSENVGVQFYTTNSDNPMNNPPVDNTNRFQHYLFQLWSGQFNDLFVSDNTTVYITYPHPIFGNVVESIPAIQDTDGDGIRDIDDNCPRHRNFTQIDDSTDAFDHGNECSYDLRITKINLVQAIQDDDNGVPLVKGKRTWAEVTLGGFGGVVDDVYVRLYKTTTSGTILEEYFTAGYRPSITFGERNSTFVFPLVDWYHDDQLHLKAEVATCFLDSIYCTGDTALENISPCQEGDEYWCHNNISNTYSFDFFETEPIILKFVPVKLKAEGYWCPPPSDQDFWNTMYRVEDMFPFTEYDVTKDDVLKYDIGNNEYDADTHKSELMGKIEDRRPFGTSGGRVYVGLVGNCENSHTLGASNGHPGDAIYTAQMIGNSTTAAHELGHAFGLLHALGIDPNDPDVFLPGGDDATAWAKTVPIDGKDYFIKCERPGPDNAQLIPQYGDHHRGSIGFWGYTSYRVMDGSPNHSHVNPSLSSDLMTYCDYRWISPHSFINLFDRFHFDFLIPLAYGDKETKYLVASGIVDSRNNILNDRFLVLPFADVYGHKNIEEVDLTIPFSKVYRNQNIVGSNFSIVQLDKTNNPLIITSISPTKISDSNMMSFQEIIPFNENTKQIQIKKGNEIIKQVAVSKNLPQVKLTLPDGRGESDNKIKITWDGWDIDGDDLSYDVFVSVNNEILWKPIVVNHKETNFLWDTSNTAGNNEYLIRVMASDGINTSFDMSDDFVTIAEKSPTPVIVSPNNNERFFVKDFIFLRGEAFDPEDGMVDNNSFEWFSNIDGKLGNQKQLSTKLSEGMHNVTLTVHDSDQNIKSKKIIIHVESDKIPDWLRNNAGWWSQDMISDEEFLNTMNFLIKENIISIHNISVFDDPTLLQMPNNLKEESGWWAKGMMPDESFINRIKFLIEHRLLPFSG